MAATHTLSGDVLTGLQELPLPQPVPYVPQTLGWLIVAIVLALLIGVAVWRVMKHRRANAYRRQALAELTQIEAALRARAPSLPSPVNGGGQETSASSSPPLAARRQIGLTASSPHARKAFPTNKENEATASFAPPSAAREEAGWGALPALLKRTAIAATSREHVASLTGDDWLRFLDRTLNSDAFSCGPGRWLPRLAYETHAEIPRDEFDALFVLSRRWIRHHDARNAATESGPTAVKESLPDSVRPETTRRALR